LAQSCQVILDYQLLHLDPVVLQSQWGHGHQRVR